jgi:multiple sugar transport system permease protein
MYSGGGGPDDSTLFYVLHLFNEAIMRYRFGYGAALAWILFGIVLLLTLGVFKSSPLWVHYEGQRARR